DLTPAGPALRALGTAFYLRELGGGAPVKLANNIMSLVKSMAVQEAFRPGPAYGLTDDEVTAVCCAGAGASSGLTDQAKIEFMLREHPRAGTAAIYHMLAKDLEMAAQAGRGAGVPLEYVEQSVDMTAPLLARRMAELGLPAVPY